MANLQEQTSKAPQARCWECPLQNSKFVPSSCPSGAKVALVSRAPGSNDTTEPFTGASKDIVDYLLKRYGYSRESVLLTNVVLCQTESPTREAIAACKPRLVNELRGIETIIAAGTEAVSEFTQYRSVIKARGYTHIDTSNRRIIAANNPALVLRESDSFPTLKTDFKLALDPHPDPIFPEVEIINDASVARNRLQDWINGNGGSYAADLEWSGLDIYCAGFSRGGNNATVFGRNVITDPECFGLLKRIYESDKTHTCWHNGKSDTSVLWRNGIKARVDSDTFLLSVAVDEEPGRHSLDYLLQIEFGWPYYEPQAVSHFKKYGTLDFYGTSAEQQTIAEYELYEYNGWDCAGTYQLMELLTDRAQKDNVYKRPYLETMLPASNAFRPVELHGFRFDAEGSANIMESEVLPRLDALKVQMQKLSGMALLNPRSNAQLKVLYYDTWGLKHSLRDKAKQKLSTSAGKEVREEIEGGRYTCIAQYRDTLAQFGKLHQSFARIERQRSNYFQSLIERVDEQGYIHPWFNLGGTVTGRPSSTDPNFQNITREGVEGISSVRELFLPSEGNVLVAADFSQAELRVMAHESKSAKLLEIYTDSSRSLHRERAAAFYGENYTKEEYVKSKNINFGVSYGQSASAFAQMYHMPKEEAQAYIDSWWREFPELLSWTKDIGQEALSGEVISPFGYKRRFHLITRDNFEDIQREAVNFVPQNTAVCFTIHALIQLTQMPQFSWLLSLHPVGVLDVEGLPVVNMVHDSLVADVPKDDAMQVAKLMKTTMEAQPKKLLNWDLPFTVDISIGDTWASVKEVEW